MAIIGIEIAVTGFLKNLLAWLRHPIQEWQRRRERQRLSVNSATQIVIEGFPRSANTFAVVAFQQAQEAEINIAHHHHHVEQVIKGVARNIPVCVLIRNPVAATKSAVLRDPGDINGRLKRYIRFYEMAWPLRENFVIAPFEEVTKDYGKTIQRINEKFGTNFSIFEHSEENRNKVFQVLDELNDRLHQGNVERSSTPSAQRSGILAKMEIEADKALMIRAEELYHKYMVAAGFTELESK